MDFIGKYLHHAVRIMLGALFFIMGLNGFFGFIPMEPMGGKAGAFLGALAETGYFFPFLKVTEITAGGLLLAGFYVPLALLILAPVALNILMFHLFLAPAGLLMAVGIWMMILYLAYIHRESYKHLFVAKIHDEYHKKVADNLVQNH